MYVLFVLNIVVTQFSLAEVVSNDSTSAIISRSTPEFSHAPVRPEVQLATIFGGPENDLRERSAEFQTELKDWRHRPVFQLRAGRGKGTAFLINDCILLTVKHVVVDSENKARTDISLQELLRVIRTSETSKRAEYRTRSVEVLEMGNYDPRKRGRHNSEGDWAIVRTRRKLGKHFGRLGLRRIDDFVPDEIFSCAGYPSDGHDFFYSSPNAKITKIVRRNHSPVRVSATCQVKSGNSGQPLMNSEGYVAGILAASLSDKYANADGTFPEEKNIPGNHPIFVPTDAFIKQLLEIIARVKCE